MTVRIRMKMMGRHKRPFFRLCAIDSRCPRDGKVIEELGYYDPIIKDAGKQVFIDKARVEYWISAGAQPSDTVKRLIKRAVDRGAAAVTEAPKA